MAVQAMTPLPSETTLETTTEKLAALRFDHHEHHTVIPPMGPPPLLNKAQLDQLSEEGHLPLNLPPYLAGQIGTLFNAAKMFFDQAEDTKNQQYPRSQGTELGYSHITGEKEYISIRHGPTSSADSSKTTATASDTRSSAPIKKNVSETTPASDSSSYQSSGPLPYSGAHSKSSKPAPGFDELNALVPELWHSTSHLLHRILVDIANYLGLPPWCWDPVLDGCMSIPAKPDEVTPSLLRVFNYLPDQGVADKHRDLGLLTLCVGSDKGLQVWSRDGENRSSTAVHGESDTAAEAHGKVDDGHNQTTAEGGSGSWQDAIGATVLVGDTLRILSTNRMSSGMHRVIGNPKGRNSIVFVLRPSTRHVLDLRLFDGEGEVDSAALWEVIRTGRVNINAQKHERQRMQAEKDRLKTKKKLEGSG